MPRSRLKHLISRALILLSVSADKVHVSQPFMKIDITSDRINQIFLVFHIVINFVNAVAFWAILESISGFKPSSVTIFMMVWTRYPFIRTVHASCDGMERDGLRHASLSKTRHMKIFFWVMLRKGYGSLYKASTKEERRQQKAKRRER